MLPALYHAHHNRHLEDLPFWLDLPSQAGDPILELGCGTGRVLVPLLRAGYHCTGLDRDPAMLKYLEENLDPSRQLTPILLVADIRQFCLARQFSLIILPCNTFSTLNADERRACLSRVRQHLKPGALFAVSLPNPSIWSSLPARPEPEIEEEFILPETSNPVQVSSTWRRTKQSFTITWIYDQLYPDGRVERITMQAVHCRHPADAFLAEIRSAGLDIIGTFGDFDRSPYTVDSPHLIILARS